MGTRKSQILQKDTLTSSRKEVCPGSLSLAVHMSRIDSKQGIMGNASLRPRTSPLLNCKVEQMISVIWKVPFVSGMFWTMLLLCFGKR